MVVHRFASIFLTAFFLTMASGVAWAQTRVGFNMSGVWSAMYHEDELERTDPGSSAGDYLGIPINDDARFRADTWDADLISVLERQCIPHSAIYAMRGPSALMISTILDPTTSAITAFIVDGSYAGPRTIWMDGRPHPSALAAHTWAGFSTGVWEGDTLRVETSHIKTGYLRRNGIAFTDQAKLTEFFQMQDRYLTLTTIAEDPAQLTEPLVRSESWVWNPYQVFSPIAGYGQCLPHPELPRPGGWVPHHLPGTNTIVKEFSESYGIPWEATRGGAETIYPEYQKKLKTMAIPRPRVFDTKFEREHPGAAKPGAAK